MRLIWYLVIFFIAYGSLYPFNFDLTRDMPAEPVDWLLNWQQRTIKSDLIANVLLFIPYGFFGALQVQQKGRRYPLLAIALMIVSGVFFALLLQVLQFYLPSRVPHAADAVINSLGILIGVSAAAYTNSQRINRLIPNRMRFELSPAMLLLVLWLGLQFFPYIPVFESTQFDKSISGLFASIWSMESWLKGTLYWLIFYAVFYQVVSTRSHIVFLLIISVFVIVIKMAMYRSHISWSEITALPFALILHRYLAINSKVVLLAIASILLMVWENVFPLQWSSQMGSIQWLPFKGVLQGSTWYNLSSLFETSLIMGSVAYFVGRWVKSYFAGALLLVLLTLIINIIQLFIEHKQTDITSVIMALIIAILMVQLAENNK